MNRRQCLQSITLPTAVIALPAVYLPSAFAQSTEKVQSLSQAQRWLDLLQTAPGVTTTGAWPLSIVLQHLAQSIEMSMDGFPEPKSALFQNTLGTAAFQVFKWRGQMSHSLSEPIPGAPVLQPTAAWQSASTRLRSAITRFEAHKAPLKPHFAYGLLPKSDYALAHAMHIANHQEEISLHRFV